MKKLVLSLVAMVCLVPSAFGKNEDFKEVYASRFAQLLQRVKTPEDLYKAIPNTEKARDLIKKDVDSKPKGAFDRAPIEMDGPNVVVIKAPKRDVRFDFAQFDEGIISVNGKKIQLDKAKTYLNYKNELESALSAKVSLFSLLVDEAQAQIYPMPMSPEDARNQVEGWKQLGRWIVQGGSAIMYHFEPEWYTFREMENSSSVTLAQNINRALRWDLQTNAPGNADDSVWIDPDVGGYRMPYFTCANGRLGYLARVRLNARGGYEPVQDIFAADGRGGWTFKAETSSNPITMDRDFKVNNNSPAKGVSFLNHVENPWRYFPRLADNCCKQNGCYQQVSAGFTPGRNRMQQEHSRPGGAGK